MREFLTLRKPRRSSSGSFGTYFKVSRDVGVKLIRSKYKHRTVQGLKRSEVWGQAVDEAAALKQAEDSGFTPAFYELIPIKIGKFYFAGLVMEHFDGQEYELARPWDEDMKSHSILKWISDAQKTLNRLGVSHNDIHSQNVLVLKNGRMVLVDFGVMNDVAEVSWLSTARDAF